MFEHIQKIALRIHLAQILIGGILFGGGLLILTTQFPYFVAWVQGGSYWTGEELISNDRPRHDIHFVNIDAESGADTGISLVNVGHGHRKRLIHLFRDTSNYGFAFVPPNQLIIIRSTTKLPDFAETKRLVGTLTPVTSRITTYVIRPMMNRWSDKYDGAMVSPYYLDMTQAEEWYIWVGITATTLCFTCAGVWVLAIGIDGLLFPHHSSVWKPIGRYADMHNESLKNVVQRIEADFAQEDKQLGDTHFSQDWLYQNNGLTFKIMRLSDVVSILTKPSTNNISRHHLIIRDRHNTVIQLPLHPEDIPDALHYLKTRLSWAKFGDH